MATGFPVKANYATGDVLTAANMNDLSGTLNTIQYPVYNAAGKNAIINGDFGIWQRGTSFSGVADQTYIADRFVAEWSASGASNTFSRQTFTAGTAPVAGYEGTYFLRCACTSGASATYLGTSQRIEDVRTFAGQTVTLSFWAKADSARNMSYVVTQNFGSGGSATIATVTSLGNNSTSWTRYSVSISIASVSGKTIGAGSYLQIGVLYAGGSSASGSANLDIWGVQVEAGLTASGFQTATGTKQGELAACQRYLPTHYVGSGTLGVLGQATGTGTAYYTLPFMVQPRVVPTGITLSTGTLKAGTSTFGDGGGTGVFNSAQLTQGQIIVTGATGLTAGNATYIYPSASITILWTGCEL